MDGVVVSRGVGGSIIEGQEQRAIIGLRGRIC